MSPITFKEVVLVYSKDGYATMISLGCMCSITDPYVFDDSLDDSAESDNGKRAPVVDAIKEFVATLVADVARQSSVSSLRNHLKEEGEISSDESIFEELFATSLYGVQIDSMSTRFVRLDDEKLQHLHQSYAGKSLRRENIEMKQQEVEALLEALQGIDPAYTRKDAERMWEGFTKETRGSFGFAFL
jgi:hypothetical protein